MAIADRKLRKQLVVELQRGAGIDRIDPILFVDGLAHDQAPTALTSFEEIIKPARANDVAKDAMNIGPLGDRHLGLRNRAICRQIDRHSAKKVKDADAAIP